MFLNEYIVKLLFSIYHQSIKKVTVNALRGIIFILLWTVITPVLLSIKSHLTAHISVGLHERGLKIPCASQFELEFISGLLKPWIIYKPGLITVKPCKWAL